MNRATSRRSATYQTTGMSDLYLLLALLGMPMVMLLFWILQQSNPSWWSDLSSRWQTQPAPPPSSNPAQTTLLPDGRRAQVLQITHRAICTSGRDSLNIRPRSSFETPIARIPCGGGVAVTGAPVLNQGEYWSPVVYGTIQGWSATRLLRKV